MGSLMFMQPWFLVGLLAALGPPIIHLIHRRRRRRVAFSSLRFLVQSDRRSARRYRLVDLLVMAMRMALLALLALALAQPVMRPAGSEGVRFGRLSMGVVLDDSASMQRAVSGNSLFTEAVEGTRRLLRGVPGDGEAFVLRSSGRTPRRLAAPASPPGSLAAGLSDLECSHSGRPLAGTIEEASRKLGHSKLQNRVLVVVTDGQRRAFEQLEILDAGALAERVDRVFILDVAGDRGTSELRRNIGVTNLTMFPRTIFPGMPVEFGARVLNCAEEPTTATVSVWVGDRNVQQRRTELEPGMPTEITLTHAVSGQGGRRVAVRLEPDGLAADNVRYSTLRVLPQIRVLLVAPRPEAVDEALFVRTALRPMDSPTYSGESPVDLTEMTWAEAGGVNFMAYDAVCAVAGPGMPAALVEDIQDYVARGGWVLAMPGVGMMESDSAAQEQVAPLFGGLPIKGVWNGRADGETEGFGEIERDHPVFSMLGRTSSELFDATRFHAYLQFDQSDLSEGHRVVARLENGAPCVLEWRGDGGRILFWASGPHPAWNTLPTQPLLLPLLYETMKYLAAPNQAERLEEGRIDSGFEAPVPFTNRRRTVRVVHPDGRERQVELAPDERRLRYRRADRPGMYTVDVPGESVEPVEVPVNLAAEEIPLERADLAEVTKALPAGTRAEVVRDARDLAERLSHAVEGIMLNPWLLGVALALMVGQLYVSNVFVRRRAEPFQRQTATGEPMR